MIHPSPEVIDALLEKACPSIQYRARIEILGQPPTGAGMADLQDAILRDERVREVIGWRQPDGWLAEDFHGSKSIEAGVRLLCEKGVSRVPALRAQVDRLGEILGAGGGWFTARLSHSYFKNWGAYTGLMLEPDWKSAERRAYDLTFWSLLILRGASDGVIP